MHLVGAFIQSDLDLRTKSNKSLWRGHMDLKPCLWMCLACFVSVAFNTYIPTTLSVHLRFLALLPFPHASYLIFFFNFSLSFFPSHQPFSSTFKQNVANHHAHSHKAAGGVKKVTGVGGTTYEISVWTTDKKESGFTLRF